MRWVRCLWQINIAGLNDREIKRVVDEIRLLKKLKHPYLIKFDSAFTKGSDRIIFITELMTSGTLQECVQGVSMPLSPSPPHPMHPRLMPRSCIPQPHLLVVVLAHARARRRGCRVWLFLSTVLRLVLLTPLCARVCVRSLVQHHLQEEVPPHQEGHQAAGTQHSAGVLPVVCIFVYVVRMLAVYTLPAHPAVV